jgi:hypothetical protein
MLKENRDPNQLLTQQLIQLKVRFKDDFSSLFTFTSLQIHKVTYCFRFSEIKVYLDINYEIEKRGHESPIAKMFGRPHCGRDRRIPFTKNLWKMLQ